MRTVHIFLSLLVLTLVSCMKHASDYIPQDGEIPNTWTFTDGTKYYWGRLPSGATLHTTPQSNNTYVLEMTGEERATGEVLTMSIALNAPKADPGSFQSGVSGSDYSTGFFYSGSSASRDAIYVSSNNNPGAVMNFDIRHFDEKNNLVRIQFNGQAFDANGNVVNISKGKLTAVVDYK